MADDLNTQLVFGANTAGAEAGVRTVRRSLKDLADSAAAAGKSIEGTGDKAGKSLAGIANGGEAAARKIQRDTSAMRGSLQRYLASLEAGSKDSRRYWETMADFKGIDRNALAPLLNQLDAYNAKTKEAAESTASWTGGLSRIGAGVAGVAAITATVGVAAKAMFDASVSAERLRTMLDFSTGGNSAKEIEYLRGITYRLGLEFTSTAKAYSQFSAAAKGTALEGDKARAVFESVAKASSVMGLSAADTSGVLLALQQMISKGTVQAEELRGQLGERLPGAFQIAAKAMGVTTGELGKMLEQGQVIADDFLPKFAAALDKNLGGAAEKAANRLDASVNRLSTAWDRLKQNSGDSGVSSFMAGQYEILADGFNGVSEAMERARGSGSGFIGQMAAGAVAAAKFANPLQAVSYSAIETGNALKQAEAEFAALQKRGDVMGGNIYYKTEMANLAALIKELKAAQAEKQKLATGAAPNMNEGVIASGRAREAYLTQRAKDEEAANTFRLNLAGVPASYVKEMQELIRLNQAGIIVGDEYTAALKKQQDELLKKTGVTKGSAAALNAEQNAYESLISSIRAKIEADNLEIAGGAALTESQRMRIKLDQDLAAGRVKLTAQNERAVRLALEELSASEAAAEAQKALAKAQADATADRMKVVQSMEASAASVQTQNDALREEIELIGLSAAQQTLVLQQRNEVIILTKEATLAELKRQSAITGTQTRVEIALESEIEALKERNALLGAKGVKNAAVDAAKTAADEWQKTTDSINQTLTDSLMRGFESGKDMARNLRDTVVSMFKTMVLRPVVSAIVSPVAGAITGALGLSTAAQAGQGISGVSTAISGASLLGSMGSLSAGLSYGAQSLFANGLGTTLTAGSQMLGAGSIMGGLGTIAGALGPIALGISLLSSMFSRKLKDQGIQGTLGGEAGFEGQQYRFYEGGLFRSDKTKYSAIDPELARVLAGSFSAVQDQVTDFAEALSLPTDRIKGFTTDIKVSFKGLDEAGIQKALQDALATGSNELAQQVLGTLTTTTREVTETLAGGMGDWGDGTMQTVTRTIEETTYAASEFARDGEQAIDTLTRLATSLSSVNTIWDQLGNTLLDASLAGADAASRIADAFGGLEAMAATTGTYFQNFYSPQEQRAAVERQLNEALGKLNLTLPDIDATNAREQYRLLAEAQDRSTDEGLKAYVMLLQLSGAFAGITAAAEDATAALKAQQDAAYDLFRRALTRDRSALQDQASALRDSIDAIADAVDMLRGNASELYNTVSTTAQMQAAQGMVYVEQALAGVLAGGSVTDYTGLQDAISAARGGIDGGVYATQFERERDALVLAGQLTTLADVSDLQLSVEERQLRAINEQLEYLDTLSKRAEEMVNGTTALTETVQTYFDQLLAILKPEPVDTAKPGGAPTFSSGPGGGGGGGGGASSPAPSRTDQILGFVESTYKDTSVLDDLRGFAITAEIKGWTQADIASAYGYSLEDIEKVFSGAGIPKFAVGTNYVPRDMLAQIHEGEAIIPKAYNPWANGQAMQGGDPELLAEMRAMRAELAEMRAASQATANNTAGLPQMADQFDTVTNGGNAMRAKALA